MASVAVGQMLLAGTVQPVGLAIMAFQIVNVSVLLHFSILTFSKVVKAKPETDMIGRPLNASMV